MAYRAYPFWDAAGQLVTLPSQPASQDGVAQAGREYAADGSVYATGEQFIDLVYSLLTYSEKYTVEYYLGLSEQQFSSHVTVTILKNDGTFGDFNGIAEYPELGRRAKRNDQWWTGVVYRIHIVEAV